uniref:Uncharacterized protein n=1 Tax=Knipowitschia caucasica TaxID=637954 RepID=A0AAV2JJ08_KNICA
MCSARNSKDTAQNPQAPWPLVEDPSLERDNRPRRAKAKTKHMFQQTMKNKMDMDAFKIQVIDNGKGISAEDIQCVGKRYFTSKCNSLEDLEDLRFYGFRGEAVASMVTLATLVEISSRTKESMKTHVKMYKEGVGLDVFEAETSRPSSGTTITVCNYFYNMPVRRKRMDSVLENERIRQRVEAISLMHPSVSFTLKNDCDDDDSGRGNSLYSIYSKWNNPVFVKPPNELPRPNLLKLRRLYKAWK